MLEQESFWENESFAVVTDQTKPAMKLTIEELIRRGKKVYIVDLSDKGDKGSISGISDLPSGIDCAVIGLTRANPADAIREMEKKGIKNFWIHWRTDTLEVRKICTEHEIQCITGKCPMMYLGRQGFNIHAMHRGIAKLFGRY